MIERVKSVIFIWFHYIPLFLFGFLAILLDMVFEFPGAVTCLELNFNTTSWRKAHGDLAKILDEVDTYYRLIVAYGILKAVCLILLVSRYKIINFGC